MAWIPVILAGLNLFGSIFGAERTQKSESRQLGEIWLAMQHQKSLATADVEKVKEMRKLNESKTKLFEAAQFQKGSYSGPLFQVVTK